jgi:hypothetical protein
MKQVNRLNRLRKKIKIVIPRVVPEESAFFPRRAKKQLPRFARDDRLTHLFRGLFSQPLGLLLRILSGLLLDSRK